jgi:hypothetical protein
MKSFLKMVMHFTPLHNGFRACVCLMIMKAGRINKFIGQGEYALVFGNYRVRITVPSDHIVGATGMLQNPKDVLTKEQIERFEKAKKTFDAPVFIVTEDEAKKKEKVRVEEKKHVGFLC